MNNEQKLEEARERLTEIAYRDEAKVVSVRAEDLQLVLASLPAPKEEEVKPLDLSNVAKHAFLSGVVAARNVPGHKECIGPDLWVDYDPAGEPSYHRILSVIDTSPVVLSANKMKPIGSVGPKGFEAPAAYARQVENTITIEFETREEVIAAYPVIDRALSAPKAEAVMMGWQEIETAPMGKSGDPSTYFIGARQDGARINVATCYRTGFGAYEWWGGGMSPTHWMPLEPLCATSPVPALTDEAVERAAKAIHDGPLGANDEEEFGDNKTSDWCREVARAALLAGGDGE